MNGVVAAIVGIAFLIGFLWLVMRWNARPSPGAMRAGRRMAVRHEDLMWAGATLQKFDQQLGAWKQRTGRSSAEYGPWLEQNDPSAFADMSRAAQILDAAGFLEITPSGALRILPNPYIGGTPGR